jgi:hypothetical protein
MSVHFNYEYKSSGVVEIVTWADGTDAQIAAMIAAADAGKINLADYWSVGDERVVSLSAMAATGVGETHTAQNATFVLMDTGANSGYKDVNDNPINFIVGMKDSLNETGYMNSSSTNAGSWDGCARRTWCNNVFRAAIPETLRGIFKRFKTVTAETYNGSTLKTSLDYFALFTEKEVLGSKMYSNATEANALKQIKYYKVAVNRIKNVNGSADIWWGRSPGSDSKSSFCFFTSTGGTGNRGASDMRGLAPFGCI